MLHTTVDPINDTVDIVNECEVGETVAASVTVDSAQVSQVRKFNRFYIGLIGLLQAGLAGTPHSLTEARVLYELAHRGPVETTELRRLLGLDAGYLSRILSRFGKEGLVAREQSAADARRQVVRLTDAGGAAFAVLDEVQHRAVEQLLQPLTSEQRDRLVTAMGMIQKTFAATPQPGGIVLRPPAPGDFGWVVARHGELYAAEYGWDAGFEAMVARIVADYIENHDPRREAAWIAETDGEPVGCVFCVRADATTAKLRLLLVDPAARNSGVGSRLVGECLRFARRARYRRIALWTNDVLTAARRIYEQAGFHLDKQEPHHSFGHNLVGQYWSRDL